MLSLNSSLDHEESATYQLTVEVEDEGGLVSSGVVIVTVEDVNDNAPQFPMSVYRVTVSEGMAPVELLTLQVRETFTLVYVEHVAVLLRC